MFFELFGNCYCYFGVVMVWEIFVVLVGGLVGVFGVYFIVVSGGNWVLFVIYMVVFVFIMMVLIFFVFEILCWDFMWVDDVIKVLCVEGGDDVFVIIVLIMVVG